MCIYSAHSGTYRKPTCLCLDQQAMLLLEESLVEQAKPNCTDRQTRRLPEV
jgi:hypothetical protein